MGDAMKRQDWLLALRTFLVVYLILWIISRTRRSRKAHVFVMGCHRRKRLSWAMQVLMSSLIWKCLSAASTGPMKTPRP